VFRGWLLPVVFDVRLCFVASGAHPLGGCNPSAAIHIASSAIFLARRYQWEELPLKGQLLKVLPCKELPLYLAAASK
jgi:hypothetical protein